MGNRTITFEKVELRGEKTVKCDEGCGRRLKRSTTLSQTISPFNKINGVPKTRSQILDELIPRIESWKKVGDTCKHCWEAKK